MSDAEKEARELLDGQLRFLVQNIRVVRLVKACRGLLEEIERLRVAEQLRAAGAK